MLAQDFVSIIGNEFFTGVPDSLLKPLCDYLLDEVGLDPQRHIIAANEGNAVALGAGYYLATGKTPAVYLQNSGIGNIINPVASLLHKKVYGIPCLFIVGWRGEPGVKDEPQHLFQGEISESLLRDLNMEVYILNKDTEPEKLRQKIGEFAQVFARGGQAAILVRKDALTYPKRVYKNRFPLLREFVIEQILKASGNDPIICTTGKAGRELFELREKRGESHGRDFLTVGSMGHASSIALGLALQRPEKRIWCIDGDGAALMHMGAMALIGATGSKNLIHVLINNSAHESVGGQPTVMEKVDLLALAKACGYTKVMGASTEEELTLALGAVTQEKELVFLEVRSAIGAREDLGRPKLPPRENMGLFREGLK